MDKEYEFRYAFLVHSKADEMATSADHSDVFQESPFVMTLDSAQPPDGLIDSLIQIRNPAIRVSSIRRRHDSVLVTLYNSGNREIMAGVDLAQEVRKVSLVKVDGTITDEVPVSNHSMTLSFGPREIKMCSLQP
jgi:DUF1680 family protein